MSNAFKNALGLRAIYYNTETPLFCYQDIFSDDAYTMATLYVKESALNKINNTVPWKLFSKIEPYNFSGIEDILSETNRNLIEVYNINGVKVSDNTNELPQGLYIVRQGNQSKKIIVK